MSFDLQFGSDLAFAHPRAAAVMEIAPVKNGKRRRTLADSAIKSSDLIPSPKVLLGGGTDLARSLWHMDQAESWKTRPKLLILLRYAGFYREYFQVAKAGVVLHTTLTNAILALDEDTIA